MKSVGIIRRIDSLGRIVIPREILRTFNIEMGDPMEIFTNGKEVVLRKYEAENACYVTGEVHDDNLNLFRGKLILSREVAEKMVEELTKVKEKK